MSEACAGEKLLPVPHVPFTVPGVAAGLNGVGALWFWSLCTCGVVYTGSSLSSPPMLASSSLSVPSLSEAIMFTLPTELLTVLLSFAIPHGTLLGPFRLGESRAMLPRDILRPGILTALCVMTGDESGVLSAIVE